MGERATSSQLANSPLSRPYFASRGLNAIPHLSDHLILLGYNKTVSSSVVSSDQRKLTDFSINGLT